MSVTDADIERARELLAEWGMERTDEGALSVRRFVYPDEWCDSIAKALADEREKARAPFLALNPMAYCNTQSGNGDPWDRGWVNAMQFITDELRRITKDS